MSKTKFTARTKARKRAVDVVFEADQKGFGHIPHLLRDLLAERCEISPAQAPMNDFSKTLVNGVAGHIDEIDDWIIRFLRNTSLERLPATDRAILRVATWEILYNNEVDGPIVIKEAIVLAEAIGGTDNSPAFMNAVLANIMKAAANEESPENHNSVQILDEDTSEPKIEQ